MKISWAIFFILTFTSSVLKVCAQVNLVPDPNFQNINTPVPPNVVTYNSLTNWFNPNNGTPDLYYYSCQIVPCYSYYIGLWLTQKSQRENIREYAGIKLTKKLNINKKYFISYFTTRFDNENLKESTSSNSLLFSSDSIRISGFGFPIYRQSQINNNLSVFLDSSNEGWIQNQLTYWYKIQSVYTPDSGNYQFMYVGNFLSDSVTPLKCLDTIGNNCKGDTYYLFRDFNVIEFTPIENYALNDTAVCIGQSISLSNEQSQSGHTYSWYTKDGFLSSNLNLLVKPLQTTKYYLYTTDSVNNICDCNPPVLDSVTVTVINYDVAGVNAITQERSLCSGDTVQFGIVERSGYSYQWQPSNYLSSDTVAQPFVQVPWYLENNILTYNVTITNTQNQSCTLNNDLAFKIVVNFCPDSLEPQIYIPNVFTPNGDGENDEFKLSTQNIKDLKAEVYNRWGIRVNSFSGVNGNWQGKTIAGDSAPTGIYYVIITAEGMDKKTYHYSGYVHLY